MASQALLKAVTSSRLTQARLMVKMDGDVNVQDSEGQTPIMRALGLPSTSLRSRFLCFLLKAGAVVSVCDNQARNAVMWACRLGTLEDVTLLLHHADVDLNLNAQNAQGQTALWTAVDGNRVEVVHQLIKALSRHEVNFEVEDHSGTTPAQLAAQLGHFRCLRTMVRHLESAGKSAWTLINISKLSQILHSSTITDTLERIAEIPQPRDSLKPIPRIQITSAGGRRASFFPEMEEEPADDPVQSSPFLTVPPASSAPIYRGQRTLNQSLTHRGMPPRQHTPHVSLRRSHREDETQTKHSSKQIRQYRTSLRPPSRSRSATNLVSAVPPRHGERGVCPPVVILTQEKTVKHLLPELLEVHVQQLSRSFRKTAVFRPLTPKAVAAPAPVLCGKMREVTFIARLKRGNSFSGLSAASGSASSGEWPTGAHDNHHGPGLARLIRSSKERLSIAHAATGSGEGRGAAHDTQGHVPGLAKLLRSSKGRLSVSHATPHAAAAAAAAHAAGGRGEGPGAGSTHDSPDGPAAAGLASEGLAAALFRSSKGRLAAAVKQSSG